MVDKFGVVNHVGVSAQQYVRVERIILRPVRYDSFLHQTIVTINRTPTVVSSPQARSGR